MLKPLMDGKDKVLDQFTGCVREEGQNLTSWSDNEIIIGMTMKE